MSCVVDRVPYIFGRTIVVYAVSFPFNIYPFGPFFLNLLLLVQTFSSNLVY